MIGIPLGLLAANATEWYLHKYALHGVPQPEGGRKSISEAFMKRHWAHHRRVRLQKYRDDDLYAPHCSSFAPQRAWCSRSLLSSP